MAEPTNWQQLQPQPQWKKITMKQKLAEKSKIGIQREKDNKKNKVNMNMNQRLISWHTHTHTRIYNGYGYQLHSFCFVLKQTKEVQKKTKSKNWNRKNLLQFFFRLPTRTHEHVMDMISRDGEAAQANRCKADDFEIEKWYQRGYMYTLHGACPSARFIFRFSFAICRIFCCHFLPRIWRSTKLKFKTAQLLLLWKIGSIHFFLALSETKSICKR